MILIRRKLSLALLGLSLMGTSTLSLGTSYKDLEAVFKSRKWDATVQMAEDLLRKNPNSEQAITKGAYALFQRGYPNAALYWLRRLSKEQWKRLRAQDEGFAEVIALLQKKVPITILPEAKDRSRETLGSNALKDEVLFSKGRKAFEAQNHTLAKQLLSQISSGSRYFVFAHYLLAVLDIKEGKYDAAAAQFSRIFEPTLFQQSSEFWKDLKTEMSPEMGASLSVLIDPNALGRVQRIGELGILGMARIHYAKKSYPEALEQYGRLAETSPYYSRAKLEQVWTLLQMNQHERAQEEASKISVDRTRFEGIEAGMVRAIVLTDAGRTEAARHQLAEFDRISQGVKRDLEKFTKFGIAESLPDFVKKDLMQDERLLALHAYQKALKEEIKSLQRAGDQYYPVYQKLAGELSSLTNKGLSARTKVVKEVVSKRARDLKALMVQAHLVRAETYLEDREKLRRSFKGKKVTESMSKEHDRDLVKLLSLSVSEVDKAIPMMAKQNPYLLFRHSELLWELGTAYLILAQTEDRELNDKRGEQLRKQSLNYSKKVVANFPNFKKRAQALFFVGFAHQEFGESAASSNAFKQFVQRYPGHENVPDAYRMLGDEQFDRNQFSAAIEYYKKILERPKSPILGYAFYKLAWSAYNLKDYPKAMVALEQAVLWANKSKTGARLLSLKKEARRDLIVLYSEVGEARRAREYFKRFIGGKTYGWLEELAGIYFESGQYEKAIHTYNVLISLTEDPKAQIGHYTKIVHSYSGLLQWEDVIKTTEELTGRHGQMLSQESKEETIAEAEKAVREASLSQHFEFKQTDSPRVVERILRLDKLYFDTFGAWSTSQDPLYKHAYFLYQRKRYPAASEAFTKHWDQFEKSLKEPLREEALRNLLSSLEKVESQRKLKDEEGSEPIALPPLAKKIVDYSGRYGIDYIGKKSSRSIAFLRASIFLKYRQWDKGLSETQSLFEMNPKDSIGKSAFKNLRVAYYKRKDWDATYNWSTALLQNATSDMRPYLKDLQTIREESLFLWAERTKDDKEAAKLFLRAARDPRMKRLKEKSLYNAIVRLHKADERAQVLSLANEMERLNGKSKSLSELAGIRAALYQEAGDYRRALPLFEKFIQNPGAGVSKEVVLQASLNTALISQGVGKASQARKLFNQYIKESKEASNVERAKKSLAYLDSKINRGIASVPFPKWESLKSTKDSFVRRPLPRKGGLGARIKGGAKRLEQIVRSLLDASEDPKTPDFYAFESYCAVPPLYAAYGDAVIGVASSLPEKDRAPVLKQLRPIAEPMQRKAEELAKECIQKSSASRHDGPEFRAINKRWGWEKDEKKTAEVGGLLRLLRSYQPWLDRAPSSLSEIQLLQEHLEKKGTPDTWYALARRRLEDKNWQLARLTAIDALSKSSDKSEEATESDKAHRARILNALAYIEWKESNPASVESLFQKAVEAGSGQAAVNLALIQLEAARRDEAKNSLEVADSLGAFAQTPDLQKSVYQFIGKKINEEEPQS